MSCFHSRKQLDPKFGITFGAGQKLQRAYCATKRSFTTVGRLQTWYPNFSGNTRRKLFAWPLHSPCSRISLSFSSSPSHSPSVALRVPFFHYSARLIIWMLWCGACVVTASSRCMATFCLVRIKTCGGKQLCGFFIEYSIIRSFRKYSILNDLEYSF